MNLGALPPVAGPHQMAEKPHVMRPERTLALIGGRQERLRFLRRGSCTSSLRIIILGLSRVIRIG